MRKLAGTALVTAVTVIANLVFVYWITAGASAAGDPSSAVAAEPPAAAETPAAPETTEVPTETPAPPSEFQVRDEGIGGLLTLSWKAGGADLAGYRLFRATGPEGEYSAGTELPPERTSYQDTGLQDGVAYRYRLAAVDAAGAESTPAEAAGVPTDVTPPPIPDGLLISDPGVGETLDLTWSTSAAVDLAGYNLYRYQSAVEGPGRINSQLLVATGFQEIGLSDGSTYTYAVTAVDHAGNESGPSSEVSGVPTDVTPPAVPTGLIVSDPATSDELSLRWTSNQDRDLASYTVYRSRSESGPYEPRARLSPAETTFRDSWLSLGTRYHYRITSVDKTGNESEPSAAVSGIPTAPPAVVVWQYGTLGVAGSSPNLLFAPRLATMQGSGNLLIADTFNFRVLEVTPAPAVLWEYGGLLEPDDVARLQNGNILVTAEQSHSVLEVDPQTRAVVWRHGNGAPGSLNGQLNAPTAARELPGGNILIVDSGNHRLIEVDRQKQVVWQFGMTGVKGSGPDRLNGPSSVQILSNSLLIADTGNNRVLEIDRATKAVTWMYTGLNLPRGAYRLRGGNTLIADTLNQRLIEVTQSGQMVWQYGSAEAGELYEPRSVEELPGPGHLLVVDQHNHRVIEIAH